MDAVSLRTVSYIVTFVGTGLTLFGGIGSWYFSNIVEKVTPFRQPIRSATATVEIFIRSDDAINTTFMDRGGYFAFGMGDKPLLIASASQCIAKQQGGTRLLYRGIFNMDAKDSAVGYQVSDLRQAKFAQVEFLPMPKNAHVLGGQVFVTVNSAIRMELPVPVQDIKDGKIYIRDIASAFKDFSN